MGIDRLLQICYNGTRGNKVSDKLTAHEAADRLGYSVRHLRKLLKLGAIEGERFNRVWMIERSEVARVKALQDAHGRWYHGKTGRS